jgi:hypothetical protein
VVCCAIIDRLRKISGQWEVWLLLACHGLRFLAG